MIARKPKVDEYPDDIFADTRMSFGDHIDELRTRMIRALLWLLLFMFIGFILDAVGNSTGNPKIGVGKPMLDIITDPIEQQVRDFYFRRNAKIEEEKLANFAKSTPEEIQRIRQKLKGNDNNLTALTAEERRLLLGAPDEMPVIVPTKDLAAAFVLKPDAPETVSLKLQVFPGFINYLGTKGEALLESRKYLTTLSAQEGFVVYFKVSIICGIVLASPFILYQFWAFIGAGLYPHERRYVYILFGPSVVLFLFGVLLCQFFVIPGALKALLSFNEWLGFDPDIRLNEWLSLALVLPLVFGVSFQTPLVMIFLNRIGTFSARDYLDKWRWACMILAVFAAVITPTPDVITMMYLFIPMFGLYMLGILFCYLFPGFEEYEDDDQPVEEVSV